MTEELFKVQKTPEMTKCDCVLVKGKQAPVINQPTVILHPSFDSRYVVGTCSRCGKNHQKRTKP